MPQIVDVSFTETPRPAKPAEPAAPPQQAEPPATTPSAQELQKQSEELYESMWPGTKPPKAEAPAPTTPATMPAQTPSAPTPPTPTVAPTEPTAAPATAPSASESTEEIISRTARATALAVTDRIQPQPATAAAAAPAFEMNVEDRQDYETLLYLEESEPEKWKGKPDQFLAYVKLHYAYREKWEKENPGKAFDADAEEHQAWYDEHQPDIDDDELKIGRASMQAERRALAKVQPALDKIASEKAIAKAMPEIVQNVTRNVYTMVESAAPDLAALLKDEKGAIAMTKERIESVRQKDPIASAILNRIVRNEVEPLIFRLEQSAIADETGKTHFPLNPAVSQIDSVIDRFRQEAESDLLSAPPEVRNQNGREFCTLSQMSQMRQSINSSGASKADKAQKLKDLDARYWTVGVDEVQAAIVAHYSEIAKNAIKEQDELARAKYAGTNGGGAPPVAQPTPAPAPVNEKPNPPSVSSQSEVVVTNAGGVIPEKSFGKEATKTMFG